MEQQQQRQFESEIQLKRNQGEILGQLVDPKSIRDLEKSKEYIHTIRFISSLKRNEENPFDLFSPHLSFISHDPPDAIFRVAYRDLLRTAVTEDRREILRRDAKN